MAEHREARARSPKAAHCSEPDCLSPVDSKGLCSKHYQADYHRRHREKRIAAASAYRLRNLEAVKATKRAYYQAHKDEHRVRMDRWRAANRERNLELMRDWGRLNRERKRMLNQARELLKKQGFEITTLDLRRIVRQQGDRCAYCGRTFGTGGTKREWDHVIPLSRGGRHSIGNLVAACHDCNASKGASYVTEWRMRLQRLGRD